MSYGSQHPKYFSTVTSCQMCAAVGSCVCTEAVMRRQMGPMKLIAVIQLDKKEPLPVCQCDSLDDLMIISLFSFNK